MPGLIVNCVGTAVILTLFGVLFALFYQKLPGKRPFWKAFVIGFTVFVASRVGDLFVDYPLSRGLVVDSTLSSVPLLLLVYPYALSRLYVREA